VDSIKKLPRPGEDTVVNKFRDACEGFIDPECHVPCHACKNADEKKNGRREETQDKVSFLHPVIAFLISI